MEAKKLEIKSLGSLNIKSPLIMSLAEGDGLADYVTDEDSIIYEIKAKNGKTAKNNLLLESAGPRKNIYFNPTHTHAAIVTCGGICPGLNNVIRAIVRSLWYRYEVRRISGIQFGYQGLLNNSPYPVIDLTPDVVDDIQEKGGTILGSARGGGKEVEQIVDSLQRMNINILFTIGGDGTLRGARDISHEIEKRGLKISIVGIPKTIDNDLQFIDASFGFQTAVDLAVQPVRGAHTEAKNSINGVGLVKVMGRESGFIAAATALAQSDVNFCLIPESKFDICGPNGLLEHLKVRLQKRKHAVILVAEGAGQDLLEETGLEDASGNKKLSDIGIFLKEKIKEYFKKEGIECNVKYIDPSYIIRSAPASPYDAIYCARLGAYATHAAMAGKTNLIISMVNNKYVHVPIDNVVKNRKHIDIEGSLWRDVLENTRQPYCMHNSCKNNLK